MGKWFESKIGFQGLFTESEEKSLWLWRGGGVGRRGRWLGGGGVKEKGFRDTDNSMAIAWGGGIRAINGNGGEQ